MWDAFASRRAEKELNPSPAPGYRDARSGALSNVGYYGFSYSSSARDSNGVYLHFDVTWLTPSNADSRAFGLPLRCLSE